MSLVDTFKEVHECGVKRRVGTSEKKEDEDTLGWLLTEVDHQHVFPTVAVILHAGGLSLEPQDYPLNVYTDPPTVLPRDILDKESRDVGEYLLKRFVAKNELFNCTESDIPSTENLTGAASLVSRAKRSKGVTLKRTSKKQEPLQKSERQIKEDKRKKVVRREMKQTECLSSEMKLCQALVSRKFRKQKGFRKHCYGL